MTLLQIGGCVYHVYIYTYHQPSDWVQCVCFWKDPTKRTSNMPDASGFSSMGSGKPKSHRWTGAVKTLIYLGTGSSEPFPATPEFGSIDTVTAKKQFEWLRYTAVQNQPSSDFFSLSVKNLWYEAWIELFSSMITMKYHEDCQLLGWCFHLANAWGWFQIVQLRSIKGDPYYPLLFC